MPRVCLGVIVLAVFAADAAAQGGGDIALDGFRPALDTNGYVTVDGAALTPPGEVAFGLYTTWAHGLLRLEGQGASYRVRDVFSPTLVASIGVPRLPLALGVTFPFGVVSATRDELRRGEQGLGDLGLHAKVGLGRRAALAGSVWLPTATDDAWLGAGAVSGQLRAVVEARRGRMRAALNGGLRVRAGGTVEYMDTPAGMPGTGARLSLGAAVPVGGAIAYEVTPGKLDVLTEAYALVPLDGGDGYAPVEALAGLKVHLAAASHLTLGGGVGLGPEHGNPDARAFLAIVFEPARAARTRTVLPDPPAPPERVADTDRDGDRIDDAVDACPDVREDRDRLEDGDGCPEDDVDGDRIADDADLCATEAEDVDAVVDDDGCPETDADGDRIADVDDKCKILAENKNGVEDGDGCPESDLLSYTDGALIILQPIHFEFDSAIIKDESLPVVRAIAAALHTHQQIRRMEIGGHTDSRGSAAYNLKLSRDRAAAVRAFLVGEGIDERRLESEGYGETRPIGRDHDQNRRVEFLILP